MSDARPTLVLGATGKTGRRVLERLAAKGVATRRGSREEGPPFDWEQPETWPAALAGVARVYVSYYPDLAVPGAADAVTRLTEVATEGGVERLVLLSGRGEPQAQLAEQVVMGSKLEWTVVRCGWFNQNFNEGYLLDPVRSGEVAMPAGDVPEPFVDADDIADVAVAALTEEGHVGQLYELTGPRLLTFDQAVKEVAAATGREITFVPVTMTEYTAAMSEFDMSDDLVWLLNHLFTEVLDGRNAYLTDGVRRALGRDPKDFADFVRDAAATGVWNAY